MTERWTGIAGDPGRVIRREWLGVVDSTNLEAERAIRAGRLGDVRSGESVQFVAEVQMGGEGRRGAAWESPRGGMWTTVAMALGGEGDRGVLEGLGLRLGVGVLRVVREFSGLRAELKWPNDVLIGERKVCGCLSRHLASGGRGWVLAGVGVNANNPIRGVEGLRRAATSLSEELGRVVDVRGLAESMGAGVARVLCEGGIPEALLEEARAALALRGSTLRLRGGEVEFEGTLEGLSEYGTPVLRTLAGEIIVAPLGAEPVYE